MTNVPTAPELLSITSNQWEEARRRFEVIRPLAELPTRTKEDVEAAATALGLAIAQVYRLLNRFKDDPKLTALVPQQRGGVHGRRLLTEEVETLVDQAIETLYMTRQRPKLTDLTIEISRRCHAAGLEPPSRKAITMRVRSKPRREMLAKREGRKVARDRLSPVVGSLEAKFPLSLVQIDHTLVDVIVVDSVTRAPIQRPWLTLAIDVYSRCVAGFHLSLEPPSATSVALCITHAVLPKEQWLAERNIEAPWPVRGLFTRLHLDNAKEFHSEALRRGCEQYGIAVDYRPVRTPHYGGHIERLIGTMMGKVHLLPGTTFSNIRAKGDLDPEKGAAMTLDELERWLGLAIAGAYQRTAHRALHMTPLAAWERGIVGDATMVGCGEPVAVTDPRRFLIDFLPIERRLVRRDGVALNSIHYWSDVLGSWIGTPQKMVVRYDPRNLSRIYLMAPDGQYYDLAYKDVRRPPISLWEHRLALKRLRDIRSLHVDEDAIFRTIANMREIVDTAVKTSKSARRQRERRLRVIQGGLNDPPPSPVPAVIDSGNEATARLPYEDMLPFEEWS